MRRTGQIFRTDCLAFDSLEPELNRAAKIGWQLLRVLPDPIPRGNEIWYTVIWSMDEYSHKEMMKEEKE